MGEPSDVQVSIVAVGLITAFEEAETILVTGEADLIALARVIVFDPRRLCKQQRFWRRCMHLREHSVSFLRTIY